MKLKKEFIIPLALLVFAILGLEITGVKFPIGTTNLHDSTAAYLTINKGLNVNGTILQNGSPISGSSVNFDTVVSDYDTARFFHKADTSRLAGVKRGNTFTGVNTFNAQMYTAAIETGNTTVTGTFDVTSGVATFGAAINLIDNTKVITASGNDILYKVTTGGAHIMETQSGTDLLKVDSANGTQLKVPGMSSSSYLGSNPLLSFKIVTVPFSTSAATMTSTAHGLTNNKILAYTVTARIDTTTISTINSANDMLILPGYSQIGQLLYSATVDSLSCNVRTLGSPNSLSLQGDTARFILFYVQ